MEGIVSLEESIWVLSDDDEDEDGDEDDEDEDEEDPALVVVVVGFSGCAVFIAGTSTRIARDREDTDGRRRRLVR